MGTETIEIHLVEKPFGYSSKEFSSLLHSLTKKEIAKRMDLNASEVQFSHTEDKKPFFLHENSKRVFFNISHTQSYGIIAFSEAFDLGIDIEEIMDIPEAAEISDISYSKEERDYLNSLPNSSEKLQSFLYIWVCKEAFLKGIGFGFLEDPKKFSFVPIQNTYQIGSTWNVRVLENLPPFLVGAISYKSIKPTIEISYRLP